MGAAVSIPKANDPPVTCPSVFDTVRHVTVYTPLGIAGTASCSSVGSPATAWTLPVRTVAPLDVTNVASDRVGSGGSVNVMRIRCGACVRSVPAAGVELLRSACASATPGTASRAAPTRNTTRQRRRTMVMPSFDSP